MAARVLAAALRVGAVLSIVGFVVAAALAADAAGTLGFDFLSYDVAVRRFLAGGVLYDQSFVVTGGFGLFYYPPPFAILAVPLSLLEPHLAAWIFTFILFATFIAAVLVMPVSSNVRWAMVLLGGLSWPLVYAIKLGQVGPILLLTFAIGWRWMDRPWRLGAATAIGTAIKLQPGIVFAWALLTGRFRAVVAGGVVLLVLAILATLAAGPSSWVDQATLLARLSKPIETPHNFTPGRVAFELGASATLAWAVQLANWLAVGLAVLAAIRWTSHVASYMAVVVASQLVSPILWDHYALMLLLPVAWLLDRRRWWVTAIPLATAVPIALSLPPIVYPLLYWITLVAILWEGRRGRAEVRPVPPRAASVEKAIDSPPTPA